MQQRAERLAQWSTQESTDPIGADRSAKASDEGRTERTSRPSCCKLPDRGAQHLPRTSDHAVAQHHVVVLEVPVSTTEL